VPLRRIPDRVAPNSGGRRAPSLPGVGLPPHVEPMLATLSRELPHDAERWTFEPKWDGIRIIAFWDGERLRLETRNLRDVTTSWPELAGLGPATGPLSWVLDGEIVAFDDALRPSFQLLQERMHVANPGAVAGLLERVPANFLAFDLLHLDGADLVDRPWTDRRRLLDALQLAGPSWATTPTFLGDGQVLLDQARHRGMEGVVAKRIDSVYLPGSRSSAWRKVKVVLDDEFVVGGWLPGQGRRTGIGSLLLGVPDDAGGLHHVGAVGTGFTDAELARLAERLRPLHRDTNPFSAGPAIRRDAVFVEPSLVVTVAFAERTRDGVLRHPSYKGLRIDKTPPDLETGASAGRDDVRTSASPAEHAGPEPAP
jgi:bifunctional non-homologous end joining protein LigD